MVTAQATEQEPEKVDRDKFYEDFGRLVSCKTRIDNQYRALKLLQQTRTIPDDLALSLIYNTLDCLSDEVSSVSGDIPGTCLNQISIKTTNLEMELRSRGINNEDMDDVMEKNPENQALGVIYSAERTRILVAIFRAYGEHDLADMVEHSREKCDEIREADEKYIARRRGGEAR